MAKSYITCATEGCDNQILIVGPNRREADRKAAWAEDQGLICDDCREHQRIEADKLAAEQNAVAGLPELTGSEKQILWAEKIRADQLAIIGELAGGQSASTNQPFYWDWANLSHFIDTDKYVEAGSLTAVTPSEAKKIMLLPAFQLGIQLLKEQTSAHWWIDNREYKLSYLLANLLKTAKPKPDPIEQALELDAQTEATVRPEQPVSETVAEITALSERVKVVFPEKIEEFRLLMRKHGFSWSGAAWVREIDKINGLPADRAAEIGHILLGSNFVIRIYDEAIRQAAIDGRYQEEQTRWIKAYTSGPESGRLCLHWSRDEDYYRAAKRLPTARYVKPNVSVTAEHFDEVLDFAELNGFSITGTALQLIEAARQAKEKALVARVETPHEQPRNKGLTGKPAELNLPDTVEIDDDLRD